MTLIARLWRDWARMSFTEMGIMVDFKRWSELSKGVLSGRESKLTSHDCSNLREDARNETPGGVGALVNLVGRIRRAGAFTASMCRTLKSIDDATTQGTYPALELKWSDAGA